jgi:hypothetical protein
MEGCVDPYIIRELTGFFSNSIEVGKFSTDHVPADEAVIVDDMKEISAHDAPRKINFVRLDWFRSAWLFVRVQAEASFFSASQQSGVPPGKIAQASHLKRDDFCALQKRINT